MRGRKDFNNDIADWDDAGFSPEEWVEEFKRVLQPKGSIFAFCAQNCFGKWHAAFDSEFDTFQYMVWHKTNPPPKIYRAGFLNSCELIVCMWNVGHTWNFGYQKDMHNFIEAPICMGDERLDNPHHPTQKPLVVLERVIDIASNRDDVILDPFMGVGSTGLASIRLGRRFIGMEIDEAYYKAAQDRMVGQTPSLFS